jgi:hypothetical protein
MVRDPRLRRILLLLMAAALVLPVAISVLAGVSTLLSALGDAMGGYVLGRIALTCGILWVINLVALIIVQTLGGLIGPDDPS